MMEHEKSSQNLQRECGANKPVKEEWESGAGLLRVAQNEEVFLVDVVHLELVQLAEALMKVECLIQIPAPRGIERLVGSWQMVHRSQRAIVLE